MLPDKDVRCPATGFAKSCHSIVTKYKCPKWVHITGKDPQSHAILDLWGCVDTFIPKLLMENSQEQRQTCASIDSLRNEVSQASGIAAVQMQLLNSSQSQDAPKLIEQK